MVPEIQPESVVIFNPQAHWGFMLGLVFLFGIVFGLMMIASEDGIAFAIPKKILCRMGKHKVTVRIGSYRINKYFCQHCRQPREFPKLKLIQGGNKMSGNDYKF